MTEKKNKTKETDRKRDRGQTNKQTKMRNEGQRSYMGLENFQQ